METVWEEIEEPRFFVRSDEASVVREACDAVWDALAKLGIDRLPGEACGADDPIREPTQRAKR